ncbi:transcriptional regulator, MerR family protein [marine gamma proteobacterium HTCC2143]|jgi:DNA-binding transcriptional MerR regulator|uniref:Transcriptional regulator, MerR family protein n=1 Tax=marine gamma proteobacterium HTCC2143 TaxID=247633 RepID=A0YEY4_9GAMM|nr:transcriptional regulator, MerR family protein [marine gamma proteobacterium HTCC2143]
MSKNKTYKISDLATEFGITTRTIRFYEEKGLLAPKRAGSTRIYQSADRVKLKLILRGKRLGLTLDESLDIIGLYDPAHGNIDQLHQLITKCQEKRTQLQQQYSDLEVMMLDLRNAEKKYQTALAEATSSHQTKIPV